MNESKYFINLFSNFVILSFTLLFIFASSTNLLYSQAQSITNNITENNTKDNQKFMFDSESKPYGISYANGPANGGSGLILFLKILIQHMMIQENIVQKAKVVLFGF